MKSLHIFKAYRDLGGISQVDLGVELGIRPPLAQARISHYESYRRVVPVWLAYKFIDLAAGSGCVFSLEDVYPRHRSGNENISLPAN